MSEQRAIDEHNQALAVVNPAPLRDDWTEARIAFVREHFCGGAPEKDAALFIEICRRRGLSPEEKQVYFIGRSDKSGRKSYTIQTSIDGYRLMAARTGDYAGSDEPVFVYGDRQTAMGRLIPEKATVTVWRFVRGQRCAFTASALWDEYSPEMNLWNTMPSVMLAKCAEAQALRKAFPVELSGIYTGDEMEQAGESAQRVAGPTITVDQETGEIIDPPGGSQSSNPYIRAIEDAANREALETVAAEIRADTTIATDEREELKNAYTMRQEQLGLRRARAAAK